MSTLLRAGQAIRAEPAGLPCTVEAFLGGGGQGEVYRAVLDGQPVALKWYFPQIATPEHRRALENLIRLGRPTPRFLWPLALAVAPDVPNFGYLMALRESRFKSIADVMNRRVDPSFSALATAGFQLADSFLALHSRGLCYRDISFGNVFLDPDLGEILVCDNDNVAVDGTAAGGILGTPDFMAPEIIRGEALPSTRTDLYSLAVLLFYLFHLHHPLFGKKVMQIHALDLPARVKLCGSEPLFIFDPHDPSNAAQPRAVDPTGEAGDNALAYWPIYPRFLRDLFVRAFTDGLHDPEHGRVREGEWRAALAQLRDWIVDCPSCTAECFYDTAALRARGGQPPNCWRCRAAVPLPPRVRIGRQIVMLNPDTRLFPHHVDERRSYDFERPVAVVTRAPSNPLSLTLQNLSSEPWHAILPDGSTHTVGPNGYLPLVQGTRIQFGRAEGEIRV
jgi:serine/threonine protein kinase